MSGPWYSPAPDSVFTGRTVRVLKMPPGILRLCVYCTSVNSDCVVMGKCGFEPVSLGYSLLMISLLSTRRTYRTSRDVRRVDNKFINLTISSWRFSKPIRIENFGENLNLEIVNPSKNLFWLPLVTVDLYIAQEDCTFCFLAYDTFINTCTGISFTNVRFDDAVIFNPFPPRSAKLRDAFPFPWALCQSKRNRTSFCAIEPP